MAKIFHDSDSAGVVVGQVTPLLAGLLTVVRLDLPYLVAVGVCVANMAVVSSLYRETLAPKDRRPFSPRRANPFSFGKLLK